MTFPALAPVVREVTTDIRERLDATEKLAPGRGHLDLGAFVRGLGGAGGGVVGGMIDYQHRLTPSTSLFGAAELGYGYGPTSSLHYQGTLGMRWRW